MIVKSLEFRDYVLPFTDGEYVMSYITQKDIPIRVLRLETEDGHVGWGEVVRRSIVDSSEVAPREEPIIKGLVGRDIADVLKTSQEVNTDDIAFRGLAFGLETAYLDLIARRAGIPLHGLLGGKVTGQVPEYYSLSCVDPNTVTETLAAEAAEWKVVQIKLGDGDRDTDIQRIRAALDTLAPEQTIMADFNGALNPISALSIISKFDDPRILWEEPCLTVADNTEVARRSGRPVMFDQCLGSLEIFTQVVAEGVAHSVCLKPPFLGGLSPARAARDICINAGMRLRVDGPWCGHIGTAACLHLAVGVPAELLVAGCDLRQPLTLDNDWGGTQHLPGRRISPEDAPGHGAIPDW